MNIRFTGLKDSRVTRWPKKDSHMDDKIPLRHIYIIHHIFAYNCHLVMTCRKNTFITSDWKQSIYCSFVLLCKFADNLWVWSLLFLVVTCAISGYVIDYAVWYRPIQPRRETVFISLRRNLRLMQCGSPSWDWTVPATFISSLVLEYDVLQLSVELAEGR